MKGPRRKLVRDPKHWRARANEMRSVAAQANDPKVKASTSGAADAYEKLAQLCEAKQHILTASTLAFASAAVATDMPT
jgi:hypothetical protein